MTLANRLVKDFQRTAPVSDSDVKAEYDKLKAVEIWRARLEEGVCSHS